MFGLIIQCVKAFGLKGIVIYLKLKLNATDNFRIPGLLYPISMRHTVTDKVTFREIFIRREYDIELPPTINVKCIIDAGANIGFTSIFFANRYPDARIISIEPDDENFEYLSKNVKPYQNIIPVKGALWHRNETIGIVDRGFGKRGLMVESQQGQRGLQAFSVNDLMKQYNLQSIDVIKIDIEGSEKEVFSENYGWLAKTNCLIIELHDRMKPGCSSTVFRAIDQYNFSLSLRGENLIFIKEKNKAN
jgi:FkbM family methyltransferase